VWAERYERAFDDISRRPDEITLVLATEMQVTYEGEQARDILPDDQQRLGLDLLGEVTVPLSPGVYEGEFNSGAC
jgi:hypothetical protein